MVHCSRRPGPGAFAPGPLAVLPGPRSRERFSEALISFALVIPDSVNPYHGLASLLPSRCRYHQDGGFVVWAFPS